MRGKGKGPTQLNVYNELQQRMIPKMYTMSEVAVLWNWGKAMDQILVQKGKGRWAPVMEAKHPAWDCLAHCLDFIKEL